MLAEPAVVSFGAASRDSSRNRARRPRPQRLDAPARRSRSGAPRSRRRASRSRSTRERVRLRPGGERATSSSAPTRSTSPTRPASRRASSSCGLADSPEVHVPWAVAVPATVDLVSRVALAPTGRACLGCDTRRSLARRGRGDGDARSSGAGRRAARGRALARRQRSSASSRAGASSCPAATRSGSPGRGPSGERLRAREVRRFASSPGPETAPAGRPRRSSTASADRAVYSPPSRSSQEA